jgi:hypothetical protein
VRLKIKALFLALIAAATWNVDAGILRFGLLVKVANALVF